MRKISNNELERLSIQEFKETQKIPVKVVLDDIRSLNNIGSVFRTADAFLIQEIHLCGITAKPPHREIQKTALGATESIEWKYFESIDDSIAELKNDNYKIYAVEQVENSISLEDFVVSSKEKIAVIFGNEVAGVNQKILKSLDGGIEIPQMGTKHSLNISVCAGIVLWHLFKTLKL